MRKSKTISSKDLLEEDFRDLEKISNQGNLLSMVVNSLDEFVWILDKDLQPTFINQSFKSYFGLEEDEDYFESSNLFPYEFNELLQSKILELQDKGKQFLADIQLPLFNQIKEKQFLDSNIYITLKKGKYNGIMGVSSLKSQKNTTQTLHENQANLIAQIENTTDSIWSINKNFEIIISNTNFCRNFKFAFGSELKEGINIIEKLPAPLNLMWKERYLRALAGEHFSETDHFEYKNAPQYVEVSFNPIHLENNVIGVACFSRDITKQKLAELAVIDSEARYKALVSNIPSISFQCKADEHWTMDFISDEVERVSGYPAKDFINNYNRTFSSIIYPEDRRMIEEAVLESRGSKDGYKVQYRIIHMNGDVKWVRERGRVQLNNQNEIEWISGFISDINQQIKAQLALEESEGKFRKIFDQSNSAISIQTDQEILMVNKAWETITGYSSEESVGMNPTDLIHPQSRHKVSTTASNRLQGKGAPPNHLLHIIDKERNEKWVDVSASIIDYEGQKSTLIIATDITTRKQAEIEINKLSTGIMNSPSSIVITDIDGAIEYVNPYFTESTGYTFEEAVGKSPEILQSGLTATEVYTELWSTINRGEIWNGEFVNKKKNGEIYWESARIAPIFDEDQIIINFIAIKEDITEQKRYQEMIEQSEKDLRDLNAKKDKFFSIIAHDLRSPFVGLVGLTDILHNNYEELSKDKITHYLKYANEAAHNVFRLLETLLEWAKSQTGRMEFKPEKIDLTEIIQDAMSLAMLSAKNKEISLVNYSFNNLSIIADKNMVFTVLRNLISNAIKYTPKEGKISIDVKTEAKTIIISITDSGVGIPIKQQSKLFKIEESYTTIGTEKERGSGLGLLICKEFVEKHAGEIWCKSDEGKGSTFSFSLPIRKSN